MNDSKFRIKDHALAASKDKAVVVEIKAKGAGAKHPPRLLRTPRVSAFLGPAISVLETVGEDAQEMPVYVVVVPSNVDFDMPYHTPGSKEVSVFDNHLGSFDADGVTYHVFGVTPTTAL
jgi:hypothetical protein